VETLDEIRFEESCKRYRAPTSVIVNRGKSVNGGIRQRLGGD
jgi:hypothetical protein